MRVEGISLKVEGSGSRVWGLEFRVAATESPFGIDMRLRGGNRRVLS